MNMPKSKFVKVKCPQCGAEQTVFDKASAEVKCSKCSAVLATPTGGKAQLAAKPSKTLT